jgi:predicted transcriptional regulator
VALEGSLKDFGLADILQLIYFQRKTGVLTLEGRMDRVRLLFIEGNIVGAESRRRIEANRLGKVLVKKGLLEEKDLKSILEEQRTTNMKIGHILMKRGIVGKEQIQEILTGQIKETVVQIFNWKRGTYEFTPQAIPVDKDLPLSVDTQHLLMDGLRIVDEWSLIEGKLTLDTVFKKKAEDITGLTEDEEDILSLIDGENDVSTLIDITAKDDFLVSKALISLMEKGVIERKEITPIVVEKIPVTVEIEKSAISYRFLPLIAIAISLLLSLSIILFSSDEIFKAFSASGSINDLRFQIQTYRFERGSYPETLDVISRNSDPWGHPYIYKQNGYTFIVKSAGADGKEGTTDDIY